MVPDRPSGSGAGPPRRAGPVSALPHPGEAGRGGDGDGVYLAEHTGVGRDDRAQGPAARAGERAASSSSRSFARRASPPRSTMTTSSTSSTAAGRPRVTSSWPWSSSTARPFTTCWRRKARCPGSARSRCWSRSRARWRPPTSRAWCTATSNPRTSWWGRRIPRADPSSTSRSSISASPTRGATRRRRGRVRHARVHAARAGAGQAARRAR